MYVLHMYACTCVPAGTPHGTGAKPHTPHPGVTTIVEMPRPDSPECTIVEEMTPCWRKSSNLGVITVVAVKFAPLRGSRAGIISNI